VTATCDRGKKQGPGIHNCLQGLSGASLFLTSYHAKQLNASILGLKQRLEAFKYPPPSPSDHPRYHPRNPQVWASGQ